MYRPRFETEHTLVQKSVLNPENLSRDDAEYLRCFVRNDQFVVADGVRPSAIGRDVYDFESASRALADADGTVYVIVSHADADYFHDVAVVSKTNAHYCAMQSR